MLSGTSKENNAQDSCLLSSDMYKQLKSFYVLSLISNVNTSSHNNEHQNQDMESMYCHLIMQVVEKMKAKDAKAYNNDKKLDDTGIKTKD